MGVANFVLAPVTSNQLPVTIQVMYSAYFYWQFVAAPSWLIRLLVTLERGLVIYFSVPVMLRTLLAHWHRDRVSMRRGTISGFAIALAWNAISRVMGFIMRSATLVVWVGVSLVTASVGAVAVAVVLLWPVLVLVGVASGSALLLQ